LNSLQLTGVVHRGLNVKPIFYVDLDKGKRNLKVFEWPEENLRMHMRDESVRNPMALESYDCRMFYSEAKAETFLKRYKRVLGKLANKRLCKSRDLPAMLYKRRYMVLSLMGLKKQTYRRYSKDWKPGQLFNLHDQVYFLTVRLISCTYDKTKRLHCYKFKVVGNA
jgi:hypothetical protein